MDISAFGPYRRRLQIILSVESIHIEKIIFIRRDGYNRPVDNTFWTHLDDTLIELVERPGYKLRLEAEFRGNWNEEFDKEIHLPKFVEKGRMTVWDGWNLKQIYYSNDKSGERE